MSMKKTLIFPALLGLLAINSGCASMVSDSTYPVQIKSSPSGKNFIVKNKSGEIIHAGVTPQIVVLKAGDGFFDGATYTVEFAAGNTQMIDSSLDPWYIGNIFSFGLVGFFIIDPATGAMWKLPESVNGGSYEASLNQTPNA